MATPNYSYEKCQKELAKKRKKEDKLKRKGEGKPDDVEGGDSDVADQDNVSEAQIDIPPAGSPPLNLSEKALFRNGDIRK